MMWIDIGVTVLLTLRIALFSRTFSSKALIRKQQGFRNYIFM